MPLGGDREFEEFKEFKEFKDLQNLKSQDRGERREAFMLNGNLPFDREEGNGHIAVESFTVCPALEIVFYWQEPY